MSFKITEMVDLLRDAGLSDDEIDIEVERTMCEAKEQFIEEYEDDPIVQAGWAQQDIIDMYRRER